MNKYGWIMGGNAPGKYLESFLHPEDAYKSAEDAAKRGYGEAQGYLKPYYQGGLDQYSRLNEATGKLLNPAELESEWSKGYETSPYAKQMLSQNLNQGQEAASAMGLMGSSAALNNVQTGASNIVNQDRKQYMDDLMQKYMQGIGLGGSLYGTGASAGGQLGQQAMQQGENMAGLEYGRTGAPGKLFGQFVGTGLNYLSPGLGQGFTGNFNTGKPGYAQ